MLDRIVYVTVEVSHPPPCELQPVIVLGATATMLERYSAYGCASASCPCGQAEVVKVDITLRRRQRK